MVGRLQGGSSTVKGYGKGKLLTQDYQDEIKEGGVRVGICPAR